MGNPLILNGYGIKITVDNGRLVIKNGNRSSEEKPESYYLQPNQKKITSILIYGQTGYISLEAFKWISLQNIQLNIFNWDGSLLSSVNQEKENNGKRKIAQYETYLDEDKRLGIAKNLIKAKITNSIKILDSLPFPVIETHLIVPYLNEVDNAKDIPELMGYEATAAKIYWKEFMKAIPEKWGFVERSGRESSDYTNTMLNYGYALLEAECLRIINTVGLDPCIGFLHEMRNEKRSLAYDLQEIFRGEIDVVVYKLLSKGYRVPKTDFLRMNNYSLRLREGGTDKLSKAYETRMSERIEYEGKLIPRRKVIERKGFELAEYVEGRRENINFLY
ncbi:MAG: CRISPR-associated endonuclease Cas1 [Methanosarcina flavescens]|jgi:CRISPR-associated protein Cas1|uniref:CRISPR-associated endonuclease Cas1 n=1 Tax=Methanosarcina flavescens TaxID=1715806 RepID=A0A660HUM5_9EURY|nr:CRISPR-associated endonuclease Cas1 [Methanosarcina flavescens]AYK15997.1 CRISPR-associated endonuclease Cas1 [Methanosarcina flavescens]